MPEEGPSSPRKTAKLGLYWGPLGPSIGEDRAKLGHVCQLVCLCSARIAFSKKNEFRLSESVIFGSPQGQDEVKIALCWDQVGLCWAWFGPMLPYVGPGWTQGGSSWPRLRPCWTYVGQCRPSEACRTQIPNGIWPQGPRATKVKRGGLTFLAGFRLDIYM